MTITLPLRLMILHFSHMGFTDGLTFMRNLLNVNALMAPVRFGQGQNLFRSLVVWLTYLVRHVIRPRVTS